MKNLKILQVKISSRELSPNTIQSCSGGGGCQTCSGGKCGGCGGGVCAGIKPKNFKNQGSKYWCTLQTLLQEI